MDDSKIYQVKVYKKSDVDDFLEYTGFIDREELTQVFWDKQKREFDTASTRHTIHSNRQKHGRGRSASSNIQFSRKYERPLVDRILDELAKERGEDV
jgi:hypothetical protein